MNEKDKKILSKYLNLIVELLFLILITIIYKPLGIFFVILFIFRGVINSE